MNNFRDDDFLNEYNEILSKAGLEHKGRFAVLASPTLNKQETISFLYQEVVTGSNNDANQKGYLRSIFLFIPRLLYHLIQLIRIAYSFKVSSLPSKAIFIRTWLVPRSLTGDEVRDDFFRQLVNDLRKEHPVIVGFQPLDYGQLLGEFKAIGKHENEIMLIGLLNIVDIISVLIEYVFSAKVVLKNEYLFRGRDIRKNINRSLSTDFYRLRSFQAYLERKIATKIKKYEPDFFLYIYENQAWEKAYLDVFKGSPTINIGYQTSGFSLRFLNFFPSKLDEKHGIFPDKIYTVGESFTEILKKIGNYPIPVITFAALRFEYPAVNGRFVVDSPAKVIHKRILYAFAVHVYQYSSIIEKLVSVLGGSDIEVWLKFHPLFNPDEIQEVLPANFKVWKVKPQTILKETYDFILFNDNSFGVEALMEGVKSYQFEFGELYPETRLLNFEVYDAVADTERLRSLKEELQNGSYEKEMDHEAIVNYINQHYKPYGQELISYFRENILTEESHP